MEKMLSEFEQEYDLELSRVRSEIAKSKAKNVLLQFPDGMKPYSNLIVKKMKHDLPKLNFITWLGSCYGACDTPILEKSSKIDLVIQFGHSPWT